MTDDANAMSTPVTRGELRAELAQLENRFDRKLDERFEHFERKFDGKLELWGGALLARIAESEKRLVGEIARHTQAVLESMTQQISVIDEKYGDLPARTALLEADVHALKQR